MQHQKQLDLLKHFPCQKYPNIKDAQQEALQIIENKASSVILELPTGSGKTAIGYTVLKALQVAGQRPLYYITPTKTLVDQVKQLHPDICVVYGRNEYPCLYYSDKNLKADEVPCSMLANCPHRVDQVTGQTKEPSIMPCPYLQQRYEASQADMVVCTMAFYLFTQLFNQAVIRPAGLIIDEVHRLARVVRNCLSYEITDYHLERVIKLLKNIEAETEAKQLTVFLREMKKIIKRRPSDTDNLLDDYEIRQLMKQLMKVDEAQLRIKVEEALAKGIVDPDTEVETLRRLEVVIRDLRRYLISLEYSLTTDDRQPLNYTYAHGIYNRANNSGKKRIKYRLVVKAYYVAPIIKKILPSFTVAYSATIGDADILGFETGIKAPFYTLSSDFPVANARVFMPEDTPNLAVKSRKKRDLPKTLRQIAKACARFASQGQRSLVVVVSEYERERMLWFCQDEKVEAVSYGNGTSAKGAALRFKDGQGDVLVGTVANYGEGIDLPKGIAPVIFFLRPGYPSPQDPATKFEQKRFGSLRWKIWNWRVMTEALQARGRNIRSSEDLGVTFFVSQQFRRFLYATLPEWLKQAYRSDQTWQQCLEEAEALLS